MLLFFIMLWALWLFFPLNVGGVAVTSEGMVVNGRQGTSVFLAHVIVVIVLSLLLAHRVNRQLLRVAMFHPEAMFLFALMFFARLSWILHCHRSMGQLYSKLHQFEDAFALIAIIPLFLVCACIDSLILFSKLKRIILIGLFLSSCFSWIWNRCGNKHWDEDTYCWRIAAREVFLSIQCQSVTFASKPR